MGVLGCLVCKTRSPAQPVWLGRRRDVLGVAPGSDGKLWKLAMAGVIVCWLWRGERRLCCAGGRWSSIEGVAMLRSKLRLSCSELSRLEGASEMQVRSRQWVRRHGPTCPDRRANLDPTSVCLQYPQGRDNHNQHILPLSSFSMTKNLCIYIATTTTYTHADDGRQSHEAVCPSSRGRE